MAVNSDRHAWGQLMSGSNPTPYGYKGQWGYYTDAESGILSLTHRYLDPATGRFLTRDPIGIEGGVNLYAYVGNDVPNNIDPFGTKVVLPGDPRWAKPPSYSPWDRIWRSGVVARHLQCIQNAARSAYAAVRKHFPKITKGEYNGPQDAFRHCVWACLVRKTCGADAYNCGVIDHENPAAPWAKGKWDRIGSPMDLANDEMGRKCSTNQNQSCEDCCLQQLKSGNLYVLPPRYWR